MCYGKQGCMAGKTHKKMKAFGLLALRLAIALIFIISGYGKLTYMHTGASAMMANIGLPGSATAYFVGALEVVGGAMLALGVFAPIAAAWLAVIMVVAILTVHRGGPLNGYFLVVLLLGSCLAIMGTGAGQYRLMGMQCWCKDCKAGCGSGGCGGNGACKCGDKGTNTATNPTEIKK